MGQLPLITVVTPSYNQGQYLERTIRSVVGQAYPNLEYIVLDGESTDQSREIIEKYGNSISYWRSAPDNGQAAAIAEGFRMANGEVLCWVNSDDMLLPGSLEYVARLFARRGDRVQWLTGAAALVDESDRVLAYRRPCPVTFKSMLCVPMGFVQTACFWRRSLYEQVGGLDPTFEFCLDYDLFLRFAYVTRPRWTLRPLGVIRYHPETKTSRMRATMHSENERIRQQWSVPVSKPQAFLYWFGRALWNKVTTAFPRDKHTFLEPPPLP